MKQPPPPPPSSPPPPPTPPPSKNDGYGNYGAYGDSGAYGNYGNYGGGGYGNYGGGGYGNYGGGGYGGYGGGGYGGYGYGYGYGYGSPAGGETTPTRNLRDYLLILRERIWIVAVVAFVIFLACVLYATHATPQYIAQAELQVEKQTKTNVAGIGATGLDDTTEMQDLQTRLYILSSRAIVDKVANLMTPQQIADFVAPFENGSTLAAHRDVRGLLGENRTVDQLHGSMDIEVTFKHPDPNVAAAVANLFAETFVNDNKQFNAKAAAEAVDSVTQASAEQQKKIEGIQASMTAMVKKWGESGIDPKDNPLITILNQQTSTVASYNNNLAAVEGQNNLIKKYQDDKQPLWDLTFIANNGPVATALADYKGAQSKLAEMSPVFDVNHPDVIKETKLRDQYETQLNEAVANAVHQVQSNYETALTEDTRAKQDLKDLQDQNTNLSELQIQYKALSDDLDTAQAIYKQERYSIESQTILYEQQAPVYKVIQPALPPAEPAEPKKGLIIAGGAILGLGFGVMTAFLVAFLDDRIKTAFDIESFVGLPLLGILPRIPHLNITEKAQAVASNSDRRITEAFRAIYSTLKLNEASKNARVILVTSTVPSEGKSFLTTNLALTYAMHGEHVLLIDCDLRMPNIAKSLGKEGHPVGLMTHINESRPFDECIIKDFYPGLDIMPTGGKTRNPTQIFQGREFTDFMARMRQQYDRVFIDSPPVGAVSDALTLLPNADGILYVIKFNAVKRKVARINVRRLMEGNVPIFGSILNQISTTSASYYYHQYDKSYKNYYEQDDEADETPPAASTPPPAVGAGTPPDSGQS